MPEAQTHNGDTVPGAGLDPGAAFHTIARFSRHAEALRADFEHHFENPQKADERHEVWNYWYIPNQYTYLRTSPERVIARPTVEALYAELQRFALERLGLTMVYWPRLSLYVEGCRQVLHNDSRNGALGYVFSITRWDQRRFTGGETQVFGDEDYWTSGRFRRGGSHTNFYHLVPSEFNQLLVFDDRLLHAVPEVRGVSDPREGRVVLHGHFAAAGMAMSGGLDTLMESGEIDGAPDGLPQLLKSLRGQTEAARGRFHGFVTCAIEVGADGAVSEVRVLTRRVLSATGGLAAQDEIARALDTMRAARFPEAPAASRITLPVLFE